ncbi:MAG: GNAT family N-acetyltransferase [Lachnospiraceae bacterium]|nr:GNAT family N-acetyltransferase [Lachnospiraceae bacterium]
MIKEITSEKNEEWNSIVRSFSDYDVFYLNEYVCAFMQEDEKNGEPILLYYENGNDRAINVVFKRDVSKDEKFSGKITDNTYFDLVSPYGYGGFLGEVEDYELLNSAYNDFCHSQHYICEFVRFELFGEYYANYDGEVETRTHNVVRNLELSVDELWMDFKQKVRKNVKKANSYNLEIVIENTDEHLDDFLKIYYSTMDRSSAENEYYFSKDFFSTINSMKDNIMYFHVIHEDKVISTELVIYGAENCYSYLGGTDREYFDLRPNDFLKYEIIKWAKEKGLKNFVLGGGYGADDGIFQYKTCLAPHGIVDFYIGRKVFDLNNYNMLVELRSKENPSCIETKYFPKYRA